MPQPVTEGGGAPTKDATGGGEVAAPIVGAQPAAPVAGGGPVEGGGATCYQPAPEPIACGQWVPAPVATGPEAPTSAPAPAPTTGSDTPPEPISAPVPDTPIDATTTPASPTVATVPASSLPSWGEWQAQFTRLGLSQEEITKLGAANLTDAQLAQVYENVHQGVVAAGGVPGQTPIPGTTPTSAWDAQWEQKFVALGLPAEFVAELKAQAMETGADAVKLEAVYQELVAKLKGAGPQDPVAPQGPDATQQPAQDQPGWNAEVEQAFRELGMPDEVIQMYAQSGAPLSGLEAAYKHAAGRVEDFTSRGWMKKFQDAKVDPVTTWGAILGDQPAKDKDLQAILDAHVKGQRSMWQKGGQLATSLFPGGRLMQYAWGKEFVSGDEIDRTDWKEMGFAALSGLAAFAAIRGGRNVMAGISARNGNFAALNGIDGTLTGLNLPKGGVSSVQDAAMGATQTWGLKQKIAAFIPGTTLHKEVVGLGHAEAAARSFNNGGAAAMAGRDADGALQLATITRMFDDIKSGATRIHGGSYGYLGPFSMKNGIMKLDSSKGQEVIKVAKNLTVGGNGNAQLVGLMEVGGGKLGANPEWLTNAKPLIDEIAGLSNQNQLTLGKVMAGNLANDLGGLVPEGMNKFSRPLRYVRDLAKTPQLDWYDALAATTKSQWPVNQMPTDLLQALSGHKLFTGIFDEAAVALGSVDRAALTPEVATLLDDAVAKMDDARVALDAVKAGGTITDEAAAAVHVFDDAADTLRQADSQVAEQLFAKYFDEGAFEQAKVAADDFVRGEWLAKLGAAADDVAPIADDALDAAAGAADDIAPLADDIANATDDALEGAALATPRTVAPAAGPAAAPAAAPTTTATGGGSVIGANWSPENSVTKFTRSIDEHIASVQRSTNTPIGTRGGAASIGTTASAASNASAPIVLTVDGAGQATTASGLIVPSYTSPVGGLAPAGIDQAGIARLSEAMQRLRG